MMVTFTPEFHSGTDTVTIAGDHQVAGTAITTASAVTVTLTTAGLVKYNLRRNDIARGEFVII